MSNWEIGNPCPNCGNVDKVIQTILSDELITVKNGNMDSIEPLDRLDVLRFICYYCNTTLREYDR